MTIVGTFDQMTTAGRNFYDGNFSRDNDRSGTPGRASVPDFSFEVGRTKAVLGLEIDLMYGQGGSNDGGFPGNNSGAAGGFAGGTKSATNGALDTNTDVGGMIEIKWIYTEFDLTGKDSLMPFIPFLTVARAGGQPYGTIANYKVYYANGDFAGLDIYSTFTPGIKNHLACVVVEDQLAGGNRAAATARTSRGEDYALIISPEFTPFKGLDLKPMFSWFHADGLTSTAARRNADQHPDRRRRHERRGGPPAVARRPVMRPTRKTATRSAWTRAGASGRSASTPRSAFQWGKYNTQAQRTDGTVGRVEGDALGLAVRHHQ